MPTPTQPNYTIKSVFSVSNSEQGPHPANLVFSTAQQAKICALMNYGENAVVKEYLSLNLPSGEVFILSRNFNGHPVQLEQNATKLDAAIRIAALNKLNPEEKRVLGLTDPYDDNK